MTIHTTHPFTDPEPDPVRRLRGRLGGTVTLWTAGDESTRAGLTVTSLMVAVGEPARLLTLLDPDADLTDVLLGTGRAVVHLLQWSDRQLAEAFAGIAPAPGGMFGLGEFESTQWGPRLVRVPSWAGVRLEDQVVIGWSALVTCRLEHIAVGAEDNPLVHRRGRFVRLHSDRA